MAYEAITVEARDRIRIVTLDRPDSGNALNSTMHRELASFWSEFKHDDDAWITIVTGAGDRHFCTGADMNEVAQANNGNEDLGEWNQNSQREHNSGLPWQFEIYKPIICAINGVCAGGGLLFVWQSDIVIASEQSTFLEPHAAVGRIPYSEILGVASRMPLGIAMRMGMMGTAERMTAERAYQLGFVSEIVPHKRLLERALEIAHIILQMSPLAVRSLKEIVVRSINSGLGMQDALALGQLITDQSRGFEDQKEGPRAFAEKRKPQWQAVPRRPRTAELIAAQMVRDLAQGKFQLGAKPVAEQTLLEAYGVSRSTIREALRMLTMQGVVEAKPGAAGGVSFQPPAPGGIATSLAIYLSQSGNTLGDLIEARLNLEPLIARLSAERATAEDIERLRCGIDAMKGDIPALAASGYADKESFIAHHHDVHYALAAGSHNAVLEVIQQSIAYINDAHTREVRYSPQRVRNIVERHRQIYEAVAAHDGAAASELVEQDAEGFLVWLKQSYPHLVKQPVRWFA